VHTLTITCKDGYFKQEFTDLNTENHLVSTDDPGLAFDDWNFDGFLDLSLWKYVGGTLGNAPHYFWLWDIDLRIFVANEELEMISEGSALVTDIENNRLISSWRESPWEIGVNYWEYRNGQFELINEP